MSAKLATGLLAIHDGHLTGTILFELLDTIRDFEVIKVGIGRATKGNVETTTETESSQKPTEFFYTDAHPEEVEARHWKGDRLDLEILASLIQPLTHSPRKGLDDDDDDEDQSKLGEEEERRRIDAQKGRVTGAEREEVAEVTSEKLERAVARLERRLRRAADSIERSLEFLDKLKSIPPQAIARQIWMAQIGAFLCGRVVTG